MHNQSDSGQVIDLSTMLRVIARRRCEALPNEFNWPNEEVNISPKHFQMHPAAFVSRQLASINTRE